MCPGGSEAAPLLGTHPALLSGMPASPSLSFPFPFGHAVLGGSHSIKNFINTRVFGFYSLQSLFGRKCPFGAEICSQTSKTRLLRNTHLFKLNLHQEAGMSTGAGRRSRSVRNLLSGSGSSQACPRILQCVPLLGGGSLQRTGEQGTSGQRLGFVLPAVHIPPRPMTAGAAPARSSEETQGDSSSSSWEGP